MPQPALHRGSIPARAGQPAAAELAAAAPRVYPRTRGATGAVEADHVYVWGLSPHARGNRRSAHYLLRHWGSIPARAGQPTMIVMIVCATTVYPRTRGATFSFAMRKSSARGLSPHARGNPLCRGGVLEVERSIPARAGQPIAFPHTTSLRKVYPRTRGATEGTDVFPRHIGGLSPHARGNHPSLDRIVGLLRSIPARAGQPGPRGTSGQVFPVYPRTRGATR